MIWALIPEPLRRALAWLAGGLVAVWGIWTAGKRHARQETALAAAERYAKTTKDTRNADTGIGATDDERIKRLRDFADKR